jgi:GNAT superfamily N-acetyltransferase
MLTLRAATPADFDFLVKVDLQDEGVSSTYQKSWGGPELARHREQMAAFINGEHQAAWIYEERESGNSVGTIMYRFRNVLTDTFHPGSAIPQIDGELFPANGKFCEIYQLWVDPIYRRQGLGSQLKQQAEAESLRRGVRMMYTHTEEQNLHVVELNRKLRYIEVRRGPIWDDIIRVSLIKRLDRDVVL